jgi:hypothetical protein
MPLFALRGRDAPGALARRIEQRPAHLAALEPLDRAGRIRFAGPLLDAAGQPCGSLVIFEAADLAAARAVAERDPYVTSGVFADWEVHELRQVFPAAN